MAWRRRHSAVDAVQWNIDKPDRAKEWLAHNGDYLLVEAYKQIGQNLHILFELGKRVAKPGDWLVMEGAHFSVMNNTTFHSEFELWWI